LEIIFTMYLGAKNGKIYVPECREYVPECREYVPECSFVGLNILQTAIYQQIIKHPQNTKIY